MQYKICNRDTEELDAQKTAIDKENEEKLRNIKISSAEQKKFWLTIILPCTLAFIFVLVIWIGVSPHISNTFLKTIVRIASIGVSTGVEINRLMALLAFSSLFLAAVPTPYSPQIELNEFLKDKEDWSFESAEVPDEIGDYMFVVPKSVTTTDVNGVSSTYRFDPNLWEIKENLINSDEIYIDVGNLKILCPTKENINK